MVGGFVGVDIFFVISGYLISSILYRNLYDQNNPGHVNIVDFYIRRVRRIFPALIAVLVFLLAIGWVILLPDEYKRLGKHVLGGSTYISNFILYYESGDYFNVDSNLKPLLHLWSLGVEEQFYLIFPIFLWGLYKLRLNILKWLLIFTSVSFFVNLYCVWSVNFNHVIHLPDLNFAFVLDKTGKGSYSFYMPWTRFWELSVGAILAYVVMFKPNITNKLQDKETTANALSIVGLLLILTSYLVIPQDNNFPGYRAALPVLGALCIIGAGQKGIVNKKILSSKIFIFFGLVSYPLYLWHWPLLSLAWICEGQQPDRWIRLALVAISIILAILTFYFIEPPLRYGKTPKIKAVALFAVLLGLGVVGYTCWHFNGYKFRYEEKMSKEEIEIKEHTKRHAQQFPFYDNNVDLCLKSLHVWNNDNDTDRLMKCAFENPEGHNQVALIGDSHVAHLYYGIIKKSKGQFSSIVLPAAVQSPFMNIGLNADAWFKEKYKTILAAYDYVLSHNNIKVVVMSHFISGGEYDVLAPDKGYYQAIYDAASRTFLKLKENGLKVIYVIDNPYIPYNPITYNRKFMHPSSTKFEARLYWDTRHVKIYNQATRDVASKFDNVTIIETKDLFCDDKFCYSNNFKGKFDGNIYLDRHHLNYKGSLYVADRIVKAILKDLGIENHDLK